MYPLANPYCHGKPTEKILRSLIESEKIHLLWVAEKIHPSSYDWLIRIVQHYISTYGNGLCLHLLIQGNIPEYKKWKRSLEQQNLTNTIQVRCHAKGEEIAAFYLGCDFFLAGMEEDCEPLYAAQFFHLPILARKLPNRPEPLGPNQLLLGDKVEEYTAAIQVLSSLQAYKEYLIQEGFKNYCHRNLESKKQENSSMASGKEKAL